MTAGLVTCLVGLISVAVPATPAWAAGATLAFTPSSAPPGSHVVAHFVDLQLKPPCQPYPVRVGRGSPLNITVMATGKLKPDCSADVPMDIPAAWQPGTYQMLARADVGFALATADLVVTAAPAPGPSPTRTTTASPGRTPSARPSPSTTDPDIPVAAPPLNWSGRPSVAPSTDPADPATAVAQPVAAADDLSTWVLAIGGTALVLAVGLGLLLWQRVRRPVS